MNFVLFTFSIVLLVIGHWFKARRWKKLISVWEDTDTVRLLKIMTVGQAFNIMLPVRGGICSGSG